VNEIEQGNSAEVPVGSGHFLMRFPRATLGAATTFGYIAARHVLSSAAA
jgi:hypothetical protein